MTVLPGDPTCAASSALRPTTTPWAICTRLSILAPALMRVSPTAGRSTVVLAPSLHVVLDDHGGHLRNLLVGAVGAPDEAVAVAANHHAVLQHHAVADRHPLAQRHVGVDDAVLAHAGARPDGDVRDGPPCARQWTRRRQSTTNGRSDTWSPSTASVGDGRHGVHARRWPLVRREDADRAGKRQVRIARAQHRRTARRCRRRAGSRPTRGWRQRPSDTWRWPRRSRRPGRPRRCPPRRRSRRRRRHRGGSRGGRPGRAASRECDCNRCSATHRVGSRIAFDEARQPVEAQFRLPPPGCAPRARPAARRVDARRRVSDRARATAPHRAMRSPWLAPRIDSQWPTTRNAKK